MFYHQRCNNNWNVSSFFIGIKVKCAKLNSTISKTTISKGYARNVLVKKCDNDWVFWMKYVLIMFSCFFFVFLPSSMFFSFELFLCFHLSLVMIQFDWKFAPCNRPARITERRGTKRQSIYIVEYVFFFVFIEFYRFFVIFMSFSLI